jgi:hypothetical protein
MNEVLPYKGRIIEVGIGTDGETYTVTIRDRKEHFLGTWGGHETKVEAILFGVKQVDDYGPEHVDLIATGYEWLCPACPEGNGYQRIAEITEFVTCGVCGTTFETAPPEHAYKH